MPMLVAQMTLKECFKKLCSLKTVCCERSQSWKTIYYIIPFTWKSKIQKPMEAESRSVVTQGLGDLGSRAWQLRCSVFSESMKMFCNGQWWLWHVSVGIPETIESNIWNEYLNKAALKKKRLNHSSSLKNAFSAMFSEIQFHHNDGESSIHYSSRLSNKQI